VKSLWDRLADELLSLDFVRQRDGGSPPDLVDGLQRALKFGKRPAKGWADSVLRWLRALRGGASESYFHHALGEQDFRNRRAKHIVYGHTHHAETVPLDASYAEGYVLNQMYFNSGTWRRVHRRTRLAPGAHEFLAGDAMTYLAFYQGDERSGRPYETWSGSLGFNLADVPVHRVDLGRVGRPPSSASSASGLHDHAPHFVAPTGKARSFHAHQR
jgi:hypothetical protein